MVLRRKEWSLCRCSEGQLMIIKVWTQPNSKNRSNKFCETLINMNSWTWERKNTSVNHKLSKGKLLVQQTYLTGCQDLSVLGQKKRKNLKASVKICWMLAPQTILHSESVKWFQRSGDAKPVIIRTRVSIIERKTKLYFMKSGNQLTMTKAARFQECSWGRFQKQANKQLRSSWFTLAVIKEEERQKIRNRKSSECLSLLCEAGAQVKRVE